MSFPKTARHADETDIIYPAVIPFALVSSCLFCGHLDRFSGFRPYALWRIVRHPHVRHYRWLSSIFFTSFLQNQPCVPILARVRCTVVGATGRALVGSHHRKHHKYSDTPQDIHSPLQSGFWFAHFRWIFSPTKSQADYDLMKDFMKFPELVWLNKYKHVPPMLLGVGVWLVSGWSGLVVGFFISTMLLFHCTFAINSLAHLIGKQSYVTGDDSRNNWFLALITFGEGWHNNHHYFQSSTRQGFYWWQIDFTYYVLRFLAFFRIVWDLRAPPATVVQGIRGIPRNVIERVAQRLATSFPIETISEQIRQAWAHTPRFEELRQRVRQSRPSARAFLTEVCRSDLPTMASLKHHAQEMFAHSQYMDLIVVRAHEMVVDAILKHLFHDLPSPMPQARHLS